MTAPAPVPAPSTGGAGTARPRDPHRGSDQAVPLRVRSRSTASTCASRAARSTGSSDRTGRARRRRSACCWASSDRRAGTPSCSAAGCPRPASTCCRGSAPWSRGRRFHPYLTGRANLARLDASDATADPRTSRHRRATEALERVGPRGGRGEALPAVLARHEAAPRPGGRPAAPARAARARRADQRPRPAGHARGPAPRPRARGRRARPCWSRRTCSPRSSRSARTSGSWAAAGCCCRATAASSTARGAARVLVQTSADHVAAVAEVLAGLGLADVSVDGTTVAALLDDTPPEKVSAAVVHAGRRPARPRGPPAQPRADLRRAHRGGLRCRSLSRPSTRPDPSPSAARSAAWRAASCGSCFGRRRNIVLLVGLALVPLLLGLVLFLTQDSALGGQGPGFIGNVTGNGLFLVVAALFICLPFLLPADHRHRVRRLHRRRGLRRDAAVPAGGARVPHAPARRQGARRAPVRRGGRALDRDRRARRRGGCSSACATSRSCPAPPSRCSTACVRVAGVVAYVGLSMTGLVAVGLFFSTLTEVPVGAMAATVVVAIVSGVLDQLPALHVIAPALLTHDWLGFAEFLRLQPDWGVLGQGHRAAGGVGGDLRRAGVEQVHHGRRLVLTGSRCRPLMAEGSSVVPDALRVSVTRTRSLAGGLDDAPDQHAAARRPAAARPRARATGRAAPASPRRRDPAGTPRGPGPHAAGRRRERTRLGGVPVRGRARPQGAVVGGARRGRAGRSGCGSSTSSALPTRSSPAPRGASWST